MGYSVIGNTVDFDSIILGSNPSAPATLCCRAYGNNKENNYMAIYIYKYNIAHYVYLDWLNKGGYWINHSASFNLNTIPLDI